MPRFYFHLREGDSIIRDDVGTALSDIETAREVARTRACNMIQGLSNRRIESDQRTIEIADPVGRVIDTLPLCNIIRVQTRTSR